MRMTVPQNMWTLKSMGQHQRLIRKNLSRQAFGNYNASIQRPVGLGTILADPSNSQEVTAASCGAASATLP